VEHPFLLQTGSEAVLNKNRDIFGQIHLYEKSEWNREYFSGNFSTLFHTQITVGDGAQITGVCFWREIFVRKIKKPI
jgi:hypothetical protein